MQHLPVEIWQDIVLALDASSEVTNRAIAGRGSKASINVVSRTLKALSLSSHAMRSIGQPLLFSRVTFGQRGKRDPRKHLQAIENILNSKPESESWIEEARISIFPKGRNSLDIESDKNIVDAISKLILRLKNLETVVIFNSMIEDALYWSLFSIPSIRKLHVSKTVFHASITDGRSNRLITPITSILADTMPMVVPGAMEQCLSRLIFASNLRTLTLRSPAGAITLYDLYGENCVSESLLELDMEEPRDAQLAGFIVAARMFPNLSTLVFSRTSGPVENAWDDIPLQLDESILPKLSKFSGAVKLARWIVPRRPIASLRIPERDGYEIWIDSAIFKPIGLTKANIVNLTLARCSGNAAWFTHISKSLPNLECIIIHLRHHLVRPWLLERSYKDLQAVPKLRKLILRGGAERLGVDEWDPEAATEEFDILTTISSFHENLSQAYLGLSPMEWSLSKDRIWFEREISKELASLLF